MSYKMKKSDFQVGQTVYLCATKHGIYRQVADGELEPPVTEWEVTKVGRRYLFVKQKSTKFVYPLEIKFDMEDDFRQAVDHGWDNYVIFLSAEDAYKEYIWKNDLIYNIKKKITEQRILEKLNYEQLQTIYGVLNEEIN